MLAFQVTDQAVKHSISVLSRISFGAYSCKYSCCLYVSPTYFKSHAWSLRSCHSHTLITHKIPSLSVNKLTIKSNHICSQHMKMQVMLGQLVNIYQCGVRIAQKAWQQGLLHSCIRLVGRDSPSFANEGFMCVLNCRSTLGSHRAQTCAGC